MSYFLKYGAVGKRVGAIATLTTLLSLLLVFDGAKPANAKQANAKEVIQFTESAQDKRIQSPQQEVGSLLAQARYLVDEHTEADLYEAAAIIKRVKEMVWWIDGFAGYNDELRAEIAAVEAQIRSVLNNPTASLEDQLAFYEYVRNWGPDFYPWVRAHQDLADTYFRLGRIDDAFDHCMKVKTCPRRADYSTTKQSDPGAK